MVEEGDRPNRGRVGGREGRGVCEIVREGRVPATQAATPGARTAQPPPGETQRASSEGPRPQSCPLARTVSSAGSSEEGLGKGSIIRVDTEGKMRAPGRGSSMCKCAEERWSPGGPCEPVKIQTRFRRKK